MGFFKELFASTKAKASTSSKGRAAAKTGGGVVGAKAVPSATGADAAPCDAGPDAVTDPHTSMILNMLDPETGPASGLPYQVHYLGPPRTPAEDDRIATVKALNKIDETAPNLKQQQDPEIASVLKLVMSIFKVPATMCALFDEKQVFVTEQEGDVIPCGHFPWRWTLCGWSLSFKNPQVLVIQDTHKDARFTNNEKVTVFPKVRFYCGAPLVASNGHRLGTLCFADVVPRQFDRSSCILMNSLAELVVRQLEKDLALKQQHKEHQKLTQTYSYLQSAMERLDNAVALFDTSTPGWTLVYSNPAWLELTGQQRGAIEGKALGDLLAAGPHNQLLPSPEQQHAVEKLQHFVVPMAHAKLSNNSKPFELVFRPAGRERMDHSTAPVSVPAALPLDGGSEDVKRFYFVVNEGGLRKQSAASSVTSASIPSRPSNCSSYCEGPVEGLRLAHLLGRGSFGSVYAGSWYGSEVAVKVIDHDVDKLVGENGAAKEANIAFQLRHPNIVSTLKVVVRPIPRHRSFYDDSFQDLNPIQPNGSYVTVGTTDPNGVLSLNSTVPNGQFGVINEENLVADLRSSNPNSNQLSIKAREEATENGCNGHSGEEQARPGWAVMTVGEGEEHQSGAQAVDSAASHTRNSFIDRSSCQGQAPQQPHSSGGGGHQDKQTWMVIEFCDRGSLQEALDQGWLMDDRMALEPKPIMEHVLRCGIEVCSALQFLHNEDVVHGDLSAWNVMLTSANTADDGRGFVCKVADFGMARTLERSVAIQTRTYGTITHMPPETLTKGRITKKMDIFSLGVLLWQLYTGSRPWSGMRQAVVIDKVVNQGARLHWPPHAPEDYVTIADMCMHPDLHARPDAADVLEGLMEVANGLGKGEE